MAYIHQESGWPEFTWDSESLAGPLVAVRHNQGTILGKMAALEFDLRAEASLAVLTSDVVKSSAIEGEKLNPDEVRSSIARRLGLDVAGLPKASRDVEGVVEMMLDGTRNFEKPLTKTRCATFVNCWIAASWSRTPAADGARPTGSASLTRWRSRRRAFRRFIPRRLATAFPCNAGPPSPSRISDGEVF
jgi:hypothetical protein